MITGRAQGYEVESSMRCKERRDGSETFEEDQALPWSRKLAIRPWYQLNWRQVGQEPESGKKVVGARASDKKGKIFKRMSKTVSLDKRVLTRREPCQDPSAGEGRKRKEKRREELETYINGPHRPRRVGAKVHVSETCRPRVLPKGFCGFWPGIRSVP